MMIPCLCFCPACGSAVLSSPVPSELRWCIRCSGRQCFLGRHSYGSRKRHLAETALRVAFADFSATPWRGLEKSERGPNNSSLFRPLAAVVVVAVRVLYRPRLQRKLAVEATKKPLTFVRDSCFGGAFSTALEPKTSSRVTVLASSVKLKLSTTRSSKT